MRKIQEFLLLKKDQALAVLDLERRSGRASTDEEARAMTLSCNRIKEMKLKMHKPIANTPSLFFLAGFFDAEACVFLSVGESSAAEGTLSINVAQKWKAILDVFKEVYGGWVGPVYETDEQLKARLQWEVEMTSRERENEREARDARREKRERAREGREAAAAGLPAISAAAAAAAAADADDIAYYFDNSNDLKDLWKGQKKRTMYQWDICEGASLALCFLSSHGVVGKGKEIKILLRFLLKRVEPEPAAATTKLLRGNQGSTLDVVKLEYYSSSEGEGEELEEGDSEVYNSSEEGEVEEEELEVGAGGAVLPRAAPMDEPVPTPASIAGRQRRPFL